MMDMETVTVRLRLLFDDRQILSKSQKLNGLNRSWLSLKPQHETISDLSSYLFHIFHLDRSCPNGILLSLDGFVLPNFESTSILKDKDIIRVKKKRGKLPDIVEVGDGTKSIEDVEIVDKQPVLTDVPLLANEEFEKEIGGYHSEAEEDEDHQLEDTFPLENPSGGNAASKKRKATEKLQSSGKRKKRRSMATEAVENDVPIGDIEIPQRHKKKKVSKRKDKPDIASTPEKAGRNNDTFDPMSSGKSEFQENGTHGLDVPHKPDGTKKTPSRSARRKKAKRQWLRELSKAEKEELNEKRSAAEDARKTYVAKKGLMTLFPDRSSDVEDEVVPIVIRPGHIRFEPLGEKAVQQNQGRAETFKRNGINSKKRGQKWGKEKFSTSRKNVHRDVNKECADMPAVEKESTVNDVNKECSDMPSVEKESTLNDVNKECSDMPAVEKENTVNDVNKKCSDMPAVEKESTPKDPIDFDKLAPLTRSPKEGDVIAYRLLELSSTWTPELSSFRVGKASFFDTESNKLALASVPEYPINFEKVDGDTSSQKPDNSIYREDGSLEIDFTSLVDIRLVKHGKLDCAKAVIGVVNESPVANKDATSGVVPQNNDKQTFAPTPEKEVNVWDEISQALSTKKAQLSQESGWTEENSGRSSSSYRENPGRSSSSYRAPRGSALGPTMALLRARNNI